jgi:hypothetical protein
LSCAASTHQTAVSELPLRSLCRYAIHHRVFRLFQHRESLFAGNCWKIIQEVVQVVIPFEIMESRHGDIHSSESRLPSGSEGWEFESL